MPKRILKKGRDTQRFFQIEFEPLSRRGSSTSGQSLLETARQLGVKLISLCGGLGRCGHCKVKIVQGGASAPNSAELQALNDRELREGYRLACQTYPDSGLTVHVPPESLSSPQRAQIEGIALDVSPEPIVQKYEVCLSAPSLSDLRADTERLCDGLKEQHHLNCADIDIEVLRELSAKLRLWDWHVCTTVRDSELISVNRWPSRQLGLALDLGTTKVAGYLVDLETGQTITSKGTVNPQVSYGEDVITRIDFARRSLEAAKRMQKMAIDSINRLAADLLSKFGFSPEDILDAVIVGNTAMHHLLLRLPVEQLARAPYVPVVKHALDIKARELTLSVSPGAYVHLLPNIAGFVGADHVATIQSTEVFKAQGISLAMDIGTNTEICLVDNGEMSCVSCASGPAFEGSHIKFGMRAATGAIEHLRIVNQSVEYYTVDNAKPVGICGSGILEAVAQLYIAGIIDESGRILDNHPNVRSPGEGREFVLVAEQERERGPAITITQEDVRALQLAKAAIRAGIDVLLEQKGFSEDQIDQVIVAGAFGSYLDISSAIAIGMLPPIPLERFRQVGNAAGSGARLALISQTKRKETQSIAGQIRYVELASVPDFRRIFLEVMSIGSREKKGTHI